MNKKKSIGEYIFDNFNYVFLFLIMFVTIYPFIYVLCMSVSNPNLLLGHQGFLLWPKGFTLEPYKLVFKNPNILTGYANTLYYVVVGTIVNVFLTLLTAYTLSRKWLLGRRFLMFFITFTMLFHGGLIPTYLLIKGLGLVDSRLVLIIPNAIAVWNIIITRTYFQGIPDSLEESARIDGANDYTILFKILIPLAMPIIAVNILFYSVGHWNSWFQAIIFIKQRSLYPLQVFLREILIQSQVSDMVDMSTPISENIKYAIVIVSIIPILCIYPFLQKHFTKGAMVGAIKE